MSLGEVATFSQYGKDLSQEANAHNVLKEFAGLSADALKTIILDLSETGLTDATLEILAPIILHPAVTELQLDNVQLSPAGINRLCEMLVRRSEPLQALSLDNNVLGVGVQSIVTLLKAHYPLRVLSLSSCNIQPHDCAAVALALFDHPFLEKLRFNLNHVGTAISEFSYMLFNSKLQYLELNSTKIEVEIAKQLGSALKYNRTLISLNIACNDLDGEFADYFGRELMTNNRLAEYHGPDTPEQLIRAICHRNQHLPANAPWSRHYDPSATDEKLSMQLINEVEVDSVKPQPSLLFLSSRQAIRDKKLTKDAIKFPNANVSCTLAEDLYRKTYDEACAFQNIPRTHYPKQ